MTTFKKLVINTLSTIRAPLIRTMKPVCNYLLLNADKNKLEPLSTKYGFDRGTPIDRYYIKNFLQDNATFIKGHCLEIGDNTYTKKYGGEKVIQADILDVDKTNECANIIGDLRNLTNVRDNIYDCLVFTQTYGVIDDFFSAIKESHRILKPGGALLATMSCISPVWSTKNHYWRFTKDSVEYSFGKYFNQNNMVIKTYGNILAGQGYWVGMSVEDIKEENLIYNDPHFPILVTITAKKD